MKAGRPELKAAVEKLYKVFSHYPLKKHVEGCPCCVHEEDKKALESKPLRALMPEDLGRYSFKAMTTWGDDNDFRHFLPRIFELLIGEKGLDWDEEVVVGKLVVAEWQSWPEQEQIAIREYFQAVWISLLEEARPRIQPDSWLCGLGGAGENLECYLDGWIEARSASAYEHLAEFIELNQPTYIKRHSLKNSFWPDSPKGVKQVCDWFASRQTRERLEAIYFENETADFAPALAHAIDQLTLTAGT